MTELGPLSIAALALLAERPMHPYEMFLVLTERKEDRLLKVRPGTLYHTVGRLERCELVRAERVEREGNRPERTTYAITDTGRKLLAERVAEMLASPAEEYPEFPVAVAEAHNLPRDQVVELLRRRLGHLDRQLDEMAATIAGVDPTVPRRFWIDATFIRTMRQTERDWVAGLVDELASGTLPWPDTPVGIGAASPTTGPTDSQTETQSESQAEPQTGPQSESQAEPQTGPQTGPQTESQAEPQTGPSTGPKRSAPSDPDDPRTEPQAGTESGRIPDPEDPRTT